MNCFKNCIFQNSLFVFGIFNKEFKIIHCCIIYIHSFSHAKHMEAVLINQLKCNSRHDASQVRSVRQLIRVTLISFPNTSMNSAALDGTYILAFW